MNEPSISELHLSLRDYVSGLRDEIKALREAVADDPAILQRAAEIRKRFSLEAKQRKEELDRALEDHQEVE